MVVKLYIKVLRFKNMIYYVQLKVLEQKEGRTKKKHETSSCIIVIIIHYRSVLRSGFKSKNHNRIISPQHTRSQKNIKTSIPKIH